MLETATRPKRRTQSAAEAIQRLRKRLPRLRQQYGVHRLWIVDTDLIAQARTRPRLVVEFGDARVSLVQFVALEQAISRALGKKVLLLERDDPALSPADVQKMVAV